jgi:dipeptidyl aminopeptidase/acylaminoacyl peptidase
MTRGGGADDLLLQGLAIFMKRVISVIAVAWWLVAPAAAEPPKGSITIDRIAEIKTPSDAAWSPDGQVIAFLWDAAGVQNLFTVRVGGPPQPVTDFQGDPETLQNDIGPFVWTDNRTLLFVHDGQLWKVSRPAKPVAIPATNGARDLSLSPDGKSVVFTANGNILSSPVDNWQPRTLTKLGGGLIASAAVVSPDGRHVAFLAAKTEQVTETYRYNGSRVGLVETHTTGRRLGIIPVSGGEPKWVPVDGTLTFVQWLDNESVLFQQLSADMKIRRIQVAALAGGVRTLWRETAERWWQPIGRDARVVVSPDRKWIGFFAALSGWTHLYVMPANATSEAGARQLTTGAFETGFGSWSSDSKRIAYYHSDGNLMERYLALVDVASGKSEPIVTLQGVSYWPRFSPDNRAVVYEHTDVENSLDLYVASVERRNAVHRLTDSMPREIQKSDLTSPAPVSFPSRADGKTVPGTLMTPKGLDRSRKHPAIVWIHGSGSDQNFLGWHPGSYRMYYSMHQYLAQQGYVILTPDYRGSSGYGTDWGTGHYMDLGGKDYLDVASGVDYLKTLGYVDPDRIGVWGLSYGGFLTLQAVTVTPTLFRCAIDVAGVSDWAKQGQTTGGGWTIGRMGWPSDNPAVYHRTASINFMDALVRPLLILHGTADTNVPIRHSFDLIDVLVKQQKDFELAIYPGEIHFFRKAHVLRSAWRRAEEFFDRQLKAGALTSSR